MDFKIIPIVNNILKKKGKKMEYVAFVEKGTGAISPSIKVYHASLYKLVYSDTETKVPTTKILVEKFTLGGAYKNEEVVQNNIEERFIEYFLENGI